MTLHKTREKCKEATDSMKQQRKQNNEIQKIRNVEETLKLSHNWKWKKQKDTYLHRILPLNVPKSLLEAATYLIQAVMVYPTKRHRYKILTKSFPLATTIDKPCE